MTEAKQHNNDWSAESSTFGDGFEVIVETEGNEADGEIPHVKADQAVMFFLSAKDDFESGSKPASTEASRTATFSISGATMSITMKADTRRVDEHANDCFEAVADELGDEWVRIDAADE